MHSHQISASQLTAQGDGFCCTQVALLQALASLVAHLEDVDAPCLQLCSQVLSIHHRPMLHLSRPCVHQPIYCNKQVTR